MTPEPNPQNPLRRRAEVRRRSVRLRSERSVGTGAFVARRLSSDAVDAECAVLAGDGEEALAATGELDAAEVARVLAGADEPVALS